MKEIKNKKELLLSKTCKEYNLSFDMVKSLLKTAEINTYTNKSSSIRKKELLELIEFHIKIQKDE